MKIGVYFNQKYISDNEQYISLIQQKLDNTEHELMMVDEPRLVKGLDLVIVLGGDGTILSIAENCIRYNVKILGVNYGHLGFLTEFERGQLSQAVDLIISKNYYVDERIALKLELNNKTYYALNDIIVQRSTSGNGFCNTIAIESTIDDCVISNVVGDGIIVSTPTGSTGYSLSAGGSIVAPHTNTMTFTPICAHSLTTRPIVFSDRSKVCLKNLTDNTRVNVIVDGRIVGTLPYLQSVKISKSYKKLKFVTANSGDDFYNKLFKKLIDWGK